jgi:hypothetical protein
MINPAKPKSLQEIEQKMENLDQSSLRYHILKNAKDFKTSWIELGRALYTVFKDKLYKEWGYGSFDIYTAREIGIRKQTAMKLLRSYYFLEKEEPAYLKKDYVESADTAAIPSYESVDLLRQAKNKKTIDADDYSALKKEVFEKGRDVSEVKKGLTAMIRQREELEPEEARERRKTATLKRFVGVLKSLKTEMEAARLAPASLIKEAAALILKFEAEIGQ